MTMILEAVVISHAGKVRTNNEDNFYLQGLYRNDVNQLQSYIYHQGTDQRALYAVADGMGGAENGELASLMVVQNLKSCEWSEIHKTAGDSIQKANEQICKEITEQKLDAMGSTLAALYIDQGKAMVCNVGDSRVYRFLHGELEQLSMDHTQVQMMVSMGLLSKEEAKTRKERHVLTQNIGIMPEEFMIEPFFSDSVSLEKEDLFMICSDGLTDMVTDSEIREILSHGTVEQKAQQLVAAALMNGGKDNITVIVLKNL